MHVIFCLKKCQINNGITILSLQNERTFNSVTDLVFALGKYKWEKDKNFAGLVVFF